jgi:RNA polymerase sigma factor (sigma-70 family)
MNATLTLDTIKAAQNNDLTATGQVIAATESRITKLAGKAARRMATNGDRFAEYAEEFEQVGRIAVWESLSRFTGDTVDSFFAFMYATVENKLMDSVREERNGATGADHDAVKVFASMLPMADGDVYLAEKLAQTVPPKGRRLSADRANAARMAWQGADSLDAPAPVAEGHGEGDIYGTLGETLSNTYGVPEDLITTDDLNKEDRRVKHALVNGILDSMGDGQRHVIRASFGIDPVPLYGYGANHNDDELAADMGTTVLKVRDARTKGLKSFAKRYVKAVATTPERAEEMTAAAAKNLTRQG